MADSQNKSYKLFIDNTEAEKALKKMEKSAAALEKEIKEIEAAGGDATKQIQKLGSTRAGIESLDKSLKSGLQKSFRDLQNDVKKLENQLRRATDPNIIRELNTQLDVAKKNLLTYEANVLKVSRAKKQLTAETRGFIGSVKDIAIGSFLGGGISSLVQNALAGVKQFFSNAIDAALEADEAVGKFKATLDNAGNPESFDRYAVGAQRLKESLQFLDDEEILGIFDKLTTYGKLSEQQIRSLAPVIIDFAAKQRIGLTEATDAIIKQLEGSGKALKTYGLDIKDAGTVTERFNVIMTELKGKVDGSAAAFRDMAAGDVKTNQQQIADLEEEIGEGLLPAYRSLLQVGREVIGFFKDLYDMVAGGYLLFRKNTAAVTELHNTLEAMRGTDRLTASIIDDFATASIAEQEARVKSNEALYNASKARVEALEQQAQASGDEYTKAVAVMLQDKRILQQTRDILKGNKDKEAQQAAAEREDVEEKKREAAAKKAASAQERSAERLAAFLKKTAQEVTGFNLSEYEKEIQAVHNKYAEFEKAATKGSEVEILLAKQKAAEIASINKKVADEATRSYVQSQRQLAELRKQKDEASRQERLRILAGARDAARALTGQLEKSVQGLATADLINADLKVRKAGLFQRLRAEKEYLKLQHQQEQEALREGLKSGELTHADYLARRAESDHAFREASYQAEIAHYQRVLDQVNTFVSGALGIFETYSQSKKAEEDAELERDKKKNEQEKKNLKLQLDGKLINREQYDQRVVALDKQLEQKEKELRLRQFKREKAINITKAIMGTAQAVVQALTAGPIIGAVLAALYGAMGAAQIATIAAQKPPEMGRGGKLKGPSHDSPDKGMPVTDPRTGKIQAYLEGDEGIVKKSAMRSGRVYTLSGTPSSITSTLNSMYGGVSWDKPATLAPAWTSYQPRQVDFPAMQDTIKHVRMFADGGQFQPTAPSPQPAAPVVQTDPLLIAMIQQNTQAINALNTQVSRGIRASVYLDELNDQQARLDNLYDDATFRA